MDIPQYLFVFIIITIALFGYFFIFTKASILFKKNKNSNTSHIYSLYSNKFLIWLTDWKFLASTILMFQYNKLVNQIVKKLNPSLKEKKVLQISCAFGDISQKIARKCSMDDAYEFVVCDIIENQLKNTQRKTKNIPNNYRFLKEDAAKLSFNNDSFDYVVMFFLFHELPDDKKESALKEAMRVLKPGGKLVIGEFHKPRIFPLQFFGKLYFEIFEPYALSMWYSFSPKKIIENSNLYKWEIDQNKYLFDNFQIVTASKK